MTAVATLPRPKGLSSGHFRAVAVNGFGDGANSYAWSCAWFDGHAYIGTNRHQLVIAKLKVPINHNMRAWPVPVPTSEQGLEKLDLRGQIWRYSPDADTWERVYQSPLTTGLNGKPTPLAPGFRNMAVFQGKSDPRPAIYTIPSCGSQGRGPVVLRSTDGRNFEVVSEPGLGLNAPHVISYRGAVPFKGRLFITPAGSRGQCNASYNTVVYCSDDPSHGNWQLSNPGAFGDPNNHGIFDMGAAGNFLYAGTINIREGFQLWKTDGEGPPPHRWTKVLDRGADRGQLNQAIACLTEYNGHLYVGTGIQHGGYDRFHNIGPAAAEIIRVYPDDTWDLVMGQPRMTRQGFMVPSSGYGPGFGNGFAGYIWRIKAHDGCIYAGTYDASSFIPFVKLDDFPASVRRLFDPVTLERFMAGRGGCDFWRSADGDHWVPVTRNGFDNRYNWGIRSILSTPRGLFVGTSNPFGPQVAVLGASGWQYEDNPRGGLEVWHGSFDNAGVDASTNDPSPTPWPGDEAPGAGHFLVLPSREQLGLAPRAGDGAERREVLDCLIDLALADGDRHAIRAVESGWDRTRGHDPVRELAVPEKDLLGPAGGVEEEVAEYFSRCGLCNVGYWLRETYTPRQAAERLLTEVLALAPDGGAAPAAVFALGREPAGLATRLRQRWPGARVETLESAAAGHCHAPKDRIKLGDYELSRQPDSTFDILVWIEGPSAVDRAAALRQARRVLKPGGRLLAADLVGCPDHAAPEAEGASAEEVVRSYPHDLERAGLVEARVLDVTRATWGRFFHHSREYFATKLLFQQVERDQYGPILAALPGGGLVPTAYLLVSAVKPAV